MAHVVLPGTVLDTIEKNYADDSDFYAIHWNTIDERVSVSEIGSTRYPGGKTNMPHDATPEVMALAVAWFTEWLTNRYIDSWELEQENTHRIGARVTLDSGKYAGMTGTIKWAKEQRSQYGTWSRGWRIGVKFDGDTERGYKFLPADNVTTVEREPFNLAELQNRAAIVAASGNFRMLAYPEAWI